MQWRKRINNIGEHCNLSSMVPGSPAKPQNVFNTLLSLKPSCSFILRI